MRLYELNAKEAAYDVSIREQFVLYESKYFVESPQDIQDFDDFINNNNKFNIDNVTPIIGNKYVPVRVVGQPNAQKIFIYYASDEYDLVKRIQVGNIDNLIFEKPDGTTASYPSKNSPAGSTNHILNTYLFDTIVDKDKFLMVLNLSKLSTWDIKLLEN